MGICEFIITLTGMLIIGFWGVLLITGVYNFKMKDKKDEE